VCVKFCNLDFCYSCNGRGRGEGAPIIKPTAERVVTDSCKIWIKSYPLNFLAMYAIISKI
jgi:prolyl-tRNA synthetase